MDFRIVFYVFSYFLYKGEGGLLQKFVKIMFAMRCYFLEKNFYLNKIKKNLNVQISLKFFKQNCQCDDISMENYACGNIFRRKLSTPSCFLFLNKIANAMKFPQKIINAIIFALGCYQSSEFSIENTHGDDILHRKYKKIREILFFYKKLSMR